MKEFLKKNKFSIILLVVLILFISFICYGEYIKKIYNGMSDKITYELCNKILEYEDLELCKVNVENYVEDYSYDTLTLYVQLLPDLGIILLLLPILIMIVSGYNIHKEFRSFNIKNKLTRVSYKRYITKEVIGSYINALIIPIFVTFYFYCCYRVSGHFDYTHAVSLKLSTLSIECLEMPLIFMLVCVLNLFMISIYYINIVLLVVKNNKNFVVTILESILIYYGVIIILSTIIPTIVHKLTNISWIVIQNNINIYEMYHYGERSLLYFSLFVFFVFIISSLLVYFSYRNKEKVIIKLEKSSI